MRVSPVMDDLVMTDGQCRYNICYAIGLHPTEYTPPLCGCGDSLTVEHAVTCGHLERVRTHNEVQNTLHRLAKDQGVPCDKARAKT